MTEPLRFDIFLPDEAATAALGAELARRLEPGDTVLLSGGLGAGKSALARSLIHAIACAGIEVPSPTFTLVQTYDTLAKPVAHLDLYRLNDPDEAAELGLEEMEATHIRLIEWPDRLGRVKPARALRIDLALAGSGRRATLEVATSIAPRFTRLAAAEALITRARFTDAQRAPLAADASARRFTRLIRGDGTRAILMDMPPRASDYAAIAHIATDVSSVLTVNAELCARGLSAPRTIASDAEQGFVLMEDLGDDTFASLITRGENMNEPMRETVRLLARMAAQDWPASVPAYDMSALRIEVSLLLDWYFSGEVPQDLRAEFIHLWTQHLAPVIPARPVWTLRDVHAANLLWLPRREGIARVGLVDTQDCVRGHPAYDLASLLQDARVEVTAATEQELFALYCAGRQPFDAADFAHAYAVYGAQRATKILGIFTRLARRDGKPAYLALRPRVAARLARNLAHPALGKLKSWYARHLPEAGA